MATPACATSWRSSARRCNCLDHLPAPELTEALIDRVVEGTAEQQGARSIAELERYRDDCLLAVLGAMKPRPGTACLRRVT